MIWNVVVYGEDGREVLRERGAFDGMFRLFVRYTLESSPSGLTSEGDDGTVRYDHANGMRVLLIRSR